MSSEDGEEDDRPLLLDSSSSQETLAAQEAATSLSPTPPLYGGRGGKGGAEDWGRKGKGEKEGGGLESETMGRGRGRGRGRMERVSMTALCSKTRLRHKKSLLPKSCCYYSSLSPTTTLYGEGGRRGLPSTLP